MPSLVSTRSGWLERTFEPVEACYRHAPAHASATLSRPSMMALLPFDTKRLKPVYLEQRNRGLFPRDKKTKSRR